MQKLNVSIYFMWEWWEKYFHCAYPRPAAIDDGKLDEMYLKRKEFLYQEFGQSGLGEKTAVMDGNYVNMVLKYGMDLIPYLHGAELTCQEAGGYMPRPFSKDALINMKPVDIAKHPFAEWLLNERDKKQKRYGSSSVFLDYEGSTNIAVRMRGEDFYMDLLDDPEFARHLLGVVNESIFNIFKFIVAEFPGDHAFALANCNVVVISPSQYVEIIKPFDIDFALNAAEITGKKDSLMIHHCDVKVDGFIDAYKDIPHLSALQAAHSSDIERIAETMPQVAFEAMFSPAEMIYKGEADLEKDISRAILLGSKELDLWNIDPAVTPDKFRKILEFIIKYGQQAGKEVVFSVIPFCWDELEWAFPRYQLK